MQIISSETPDSPIPTVTVKLSPDELVILHVLTSQITYPSAQAAWCDRFFAPLRQRSNGRTCATHDAYRNLSDNLREALR